MRRLGKFRWLLAIVIVLAVLALLPFFGYWSTQQAPDYYVEALEQEQVNVTELREASRDMTRKVVALEGDVRQQGEWQAIFTEEQINGWLAVDLMEKHAGVLPNGARDPRVFIREDNATIACFFDGIWPPAVYTLDFEPFVTDPNTLAIRLRRLRAGALPVPLGPVLDQLKERAAHHDLPLKWAATDGDPVALFTLPTPEDIKGKQLLLEAVEVRDGAIVLSGRTEKQKADTVP